MSSFERHGFGPPEGPDLWNRATRMGLHNVDMGRLWRLARGFPLVLAGLTH
jgi:hypothetical protein